MLKEIYPDIYMITERADGSSLWPSVNIFAIIGSNGLIFDAGYGTRKDVNYLVKNIRFILKMNPESRISRVLISHTHVDHFAGLKKLGDLLGVKIILTERMARFIKSKKDYFNLYHNKKPEYINESYTKSERILNLIKQRLIGLVYRHLIGIKFIQEPDEIIGENTEIDINGEKWMILHTPGHAVDHISLYDPNRGILFAGDNVLSDITTWLGKPWSDISEYMGTLEKILNLPKLEIILGAHGDPITNPKNRIQELISWRNRRVEDVREVIKMRKSDGIYLRDIIRELYPNNNTFYRDMAGGWIELTVEKLLDENEIKPLKINGRVKFYPQD